MFFPARLAVACLLAGVLTTATGAGRATADPSDPTGTTGPTGPHARHGAASPWTTLAMRDLFLARPSLDGLDSVVASVLLARPSDGASDTGGDGY
ncbi:hypothetical protein, partial [Nocardioides stalactiti]|uniref:hypothetical protein n=1 Tax=Nocardioides stalactiti TaxID=2755356 RepID=UPI001C81D37B